MSLYFLRHLKTTNNERGILSGRISCEILPGSFVRNSTDCTFFDKVYSSPSSRCKDTLSEAKKIVSFNDICYTDILLERNIGILEGMFREEAILKYPNYFQNGKLRVDITPQHGESINNIQQRLKPLLSEIINISKTGNCLICSHNQTLKILYAIIMNIEVTNEYWFNNNYKNGIIVEVFVHNS